jgi:hypothetical protein
VFINLTGDVAGAWTTNSNAGLVWGIDLGSGTNFNTTANTWQTGNFLRTAGCVTFVNQVAGSTLNITGVQVEQVSPGAAYGTAFEHVPYGTQMSWCQRYVPCFNSASTTDSLMAWSNGSANTSGLGILTFPVPTRVRVTGVVVSSWAHILLTSGVALTTAGIAGASLNSVTLSGGYTASGIAYGSSAAFFGSASGQLYFTGAQM